MSHMLKEYRGVIDLIYIDPPFDSKADYKKKIEIKGVGKTESDATSFEEKHMEISGQTMNIFNLCMND